MLLAYKNHLFSTYFYYSRSDRFLPFFLFEKEQGKRE